MNKFFRIVTLVNFFVNTFLLWTMWETTKLLVQMGLSLDFLSSVLLEHVADSIFKF